MNNVLLILLLALVWGCSGGSGTNATLVVSRSFTIGAQTGGLMLYVHNKTKNTVSATALQSTTQTIKLEHGDYDFKAIGWDGSKPLEGNLLCGGTAANLKDPTAKVEISINSNNCKTDAFVPATYHATGGVSTLKLVSCLDVTSVLSMSDECNNSFRGTIASYKVKLNGFGDTAFSSNPSSTSALKSECITAISSPEGTTTTNRKLPYGSASMMFSTTIETYTDSACTSNLKEYHFPKGLAQSSNPDTKIFSSGYYTQLYLEHDMTVPVVISNISISTANLNGGYYYAKSGDIIDISFDANVPGTYPLTLFGTSYNPSSSGNTHTFAYTVNGTEPDGMVTFEIQAGGTTYDFTLAPVLAFIDKTAPTMPTPTASAGSTTNINPIIAVSGLELDAKVQLFSDASCSIPMSPSLTATAATFNITTMPLSIGDTLIYANQTDKAGNTSPCSSTSALVQYLPLNLSNVSIVSSNPSNNQVVGPGQTVTLNFQSNLNMPHTVTINGQNVSVGGTYPNYSANYYIQYTDMEGPVSFNISLGTTFLNNPPTYDGSNVIFDKTVPTPMVALAPGVLPEDFFTQPSLQLSNMEMNATGGLYYDPSCAGSLAMPFNVTSPSMTIQTPPLPVGEHDIYIKQTDQAGNISTCSPVVEYRLKQAFISEWVVANGETINLPLPSGLNYNFKVDWGNGNVTNHNSNSASYTYPVAGTYTITITGLMEGWSFNGTGNKLNIRKVHNLGELGWKKFLGGFQGCTNLTVFNGGVTRDVTDMGRMFSGATLVTPNTTDWDTSRVYNMASMFKDTQNANPDMTGWNTSLVTHMDSMFENAAVATPDVTGWNTEMVIQMNNMFKNAPLANPDVSGWNTTQVQKMDGMFHYAVSANPDVTSWNTANVQLMNNMFFGATNADPNTSTWNFGAVTDLTGIFTNSNISVDNWSGFLVAASVNGPDGQIIDSPQYYDPLIVTTPVLNTLTVTKFWTINGLAPEP